MNTQWWIFTGLLGLVILLDVWQRRLDRRRIAELDRQLLTALGIITEKNDALRECEAANAQLDERNERLHKDIAAMRERLPRVALGAAPVQFWICGIDGHNIVEWRDNVAYCMTFGCGRNSLADQLTPTALDDDRDTFDREVKHGWGATDVGRGWADPDPTRPYIATYEAGEGEQR